MCVIQAVVESALSTVWKLASGCPVNCKTFEELDAAGQAAGEAAKEECISELIAKAMSHHDEDEPTLQEQACLAVTALAEGSVRHEFPSACHTRVKVCAVFNPSSKVVPVLLRRGVLGLVRRRRRWR